MAQPAQVWEPIPVPVTHRKLPGFPEHQGVARLRKRHPAREHHRPVPLVASHRPRPITQARHEPVRPVRPAAKRRIPTLRPVPPAARVQAPRVVRVAHLT